MAEKGTFRYESVQDMDTIIEYLEALAQGFRSGRLELAQGGEELVLEPQGLVGFSVDAQLRGSRRKLILKFGWKESAPRAGEETPLIMKAGGGEAE